MKIVHAVYSMEMGGAEMLVAQLCRLQRSHGHDVTICAYSKLGSLGEMLRDEGFAITILGEAHPVKTMLRYFNLFRAMKPDVVHMHNVAPTLQAAPGARLADASCVIATRHSLVSPPYNRAEEIKFSSFSWLWLDWIVGICEITCQNLRHAPLARRNRIMRVYNGTNPIAGARSEFETNRFNLLFVGRLAAIKDLPTLLHAVALATTRVPHLHLSIVGDGPVRLHLEHLANELGISERVTFFGQQMDTGPFFHSADAFVMSSVSEGLPMSLLQAMSAGLPAVLTDVGGMREVLQRSQSGLLAPVGNSALMAEAIVELATNDALRIEFRQRALSAFQQEFTLEQMDAAYMDLYRRARST
ncbi:MAG: glycosyltransferase [Acidobacteria bacterium]|nr:glycosyltransferase [Acidobacteriota bacterium]